MSLARHKSWKQYHFLMKKKATRATRETAERTRIIDEVLKLVFVCSVRTNPGQTKSANHQLFVSSVQWKKTRFSPIIFLSFSLCSLSSTENVLTDSISPTFLDLYVCSLSLFPLYPMLWFKVACSIISSFATCNRFLTKTSFFLCCDHHVRDFVFLPCRQRQTPACFVLCLWHASVW